MMPPALPKLPQPAKNASRVPAAIQIGGVLVVSLGLTLVAIWLGVVALGVGLIGIGTLLELQ